MHTLYCIIAADLSCLEQYTVIWQPYLFMNNSTHCKSFDIRLGESWSVRINPIFKKGIKTIQYINKIKHF
jgi:hypothetical protein